MQLFENLYLHVRIREKVEFKRNHNNKMEITLPMTSYDFVRAGKAEMFESPHFTQFTADKSICRN